MCQVRSTLAVRLGPPDELSRSDPLAKSDADPVMPDLREIDGVGIALQTLLNRLSQVLLP
jgi:hypothetical protein